MHIDTGISQEARREIAQGLARLLADSYLLYVKTQGFHWNVTGPMFSTLHLLFEQEYTELAAAVDEIAERIRALGETAPGSGRQFAELASVGEETGAPSAEKMIRQLAQDQEKVIRTARDIFPAADAAKDEATQDLLTRRIHSHEKNAWMLRSHLD